MNDKDNPFQLPNEIENGVDEVLNNSGGAVNFELTGALESEAEPAIEPRAKKIFKKVLKSTALAVGSLTGAPYVQAAYTMGQRIYPVLSLPMAASTFIAVSAYGMYGYSEYTKRFTRSKIEALQPTNELPNRFLIYITNHIPCPVIELAVHKVPYRFIIREVSLAIISWISIGPIVFLSIVLNKGVTPLSLLPLATDWGLRMSSMTNAWNQAKLQWRLNRFSKTTAEQKARLILLQTLVAKTKFALGYLHHLPSEAIQDLQMPPVKRADEKIVFAESWEQLIIELLKVNNKIKTKQDISLLKSNFSKLLMNGVGFFSAGCLIAFELYASYKGCDLVSLTHFHKSHWAINLGFSIGVVLPVVYLQQDVIRAVNKQFYHSAITYVYAVNESTWISEEYPIISKLKIAVCVGIMMLAWGHISLFLDNNFDGWLLMLTWLLIIPSNTILLLGGLLDISEKFLLYFLEKKPKNKTEATFVHIDSTLEQLFDELLINLDAADEVIDNLDPKIVELLEPSASAQESQPQANEESIVEGNFQSCFLLTWLGNCIKSAEQPEPASLPAPSI